MNQKNKVTGFFALLTPEQQAAALAYTGPDNHGDMQWLLDEKKLEQDRELRQNMSDALREARGEDYE